jgi:hypothetical protein
MSALTNKYISDTYLGLLHAEDQLPETGQTAIYDGNGVRSALDVGALGNGVSVSGQFKATEFVYPSVDSGYNTIMVSDGAKNLSLKSLPDIIASLGGESQLTGTYSNPRITMNNGVITAIVNVVTGGMRAITAVGANNTFTIPTDVYKVKFSLTGGGGKGFKKSGSAGATVIGYMDVTPGQKFGVIVGAAGSTGSPDGGTSQILYNNDALITAYGGINSTYEHSDGSSVTVGATGMVSSSGLLFISTYSGTPSYVVVPGGLGLVDTDEADEESGGAASYWGCGPAFGGGNSSHNKSARGQAGTGVCVFEW